MKTNKQRFQEGFKDGNLNKVRGGILAALEHGEPSDEIFRYRLSLLAISSLSKLNADGLKSTLKLLKVDNRGKVEMLLEEYKNEWVELGL